MSMSIFSKGSKVEISWCWVLAINCSIEFKLFSPFFSKGELDWLLDPMND